ncbi:hypothetical protein KP79_PYT07047 [Mizuhopecten yessoensis]|uniref:Uncharacterized protein n=1 Tax=Mizuhopecten yessoensis TaxID=6573 RepID=A0A210R2F5_MIZYE|nr:hypothetical protein KP79_PYT07047 [Mizuhopecten yessoensis]
MEFVRWELHVDVATPASAATHARVLIARPDVNVEAPTSCAPKIVSQGNAAEPKTASATGSVHAQNAGATAHLGLARAVWAVLDQTHASVVQVARVKSKR